MADEITLSGSLAYEDSEGSEISLALAALSASIGTKKFIHNKISVGTSEEAIPLGEVSSLGWSIFINRDATNYLELRTGTGASNDAIKVPPLKFALFHWGSDVSAPYAIANTAACQMEYLISSQ